MQNALIISQTVFYISASLAIIIIGVGTGMVVYYVVRIAKELQKISRDLRETSDILTERIGDIIDRLLELPFISFLFKKSKRNSKK